MGVLDMNAATRPLFPKLTLALIVTAVLAGLAADITWEFWARVITPLTSQRTVGIHLPGTPYADIEAAQRNGWMYDSIITVDTGQAFVVRVQTQFCALQLRQEVYAKYVVDSVFPADRRIRMRGRVNPNCGFRSFADGIPKF